MKTLLIAGLAGVLAMTPGTAFAAIDSVPKGAALETPVDLALVSTTALTDIVQGTKAPRMGRHSMHKPNMRGMHRMKAGHANKGYRGMHRKKRGHVNKGHANRGHYNRGGHRYNDGHKVRMGRVKNRHGYQRPHRGFQLPRTYIQPSFFIGSFGRYGLSQPSYGYGWSRYYDDAVLTDRRGVVHDTRYNVDWDRYNQGYNDGYHDGQATYDNSVFMNDDRVLAPPVAAGPADRLYRPGNSGGTYQGNWNGAYRSDGSYQGDWRGTYRGADGRVYDGQYSGTFIGESNVTPHWGNSVRRGTVPQDYERGPGDYNDELAYLERCKKSSGIGGSVVGGAIGALAGNRIAGRGSRLGGSLIGGGLGAIAGGAIQRGTDKCRKLLKKYGGRSDYGTSYGPDYSGATAPRGPRYQPQRRPAPQHRQQYPSGWNGGYYYPAYYYPQQQAPMVTTVVIQSQPVTTTTTTTFVEEEVIYEKARPVYKKRWKPAPKRKWKPRPKAAPILKGCQQAHC